MSERSIKLSIAALGGQGGGVLANWLIEVAEAEGYLAQSTSVPGVAQRTGATIYYLEFFPRALAERAGREPVMALTPVSGDVDCVLASELAEAGRAIQRGLVTPDRTILISSTHRSYVIAEKSALGSGAADTQGLLEIVRSHAKRLVLFDMEATAERNGSLISSVLLGALAGSGAMPFRRETFVAAIQRSGMAVRANLAAFEDAFQQATLGDSGYAGQGRPALQGLPPQARTPALQPLLERIRRLPASAQPTILEGARRSIDYQDPAYADLYLARIERIAGCEARLHAPEVNCPLLEATARGLALWMTFEDPIRVADLKTRASRFARVRDEIRAPPGQLFGITEFVRPRVAEIAGTMPAGLGRWILRSPRVSAWLARWTGGKQIRTSTVSGFALLYLLGGLKRWRRSSLRFQEENARIEDWLARVERLAQGNHSLAVEVARAQRLIKGYGETHERGWRNFSILMDQLESLAVRADGAIWLGRLHEASLADEEGISLRAVLAELQNSSAGQVPTQRARA
ncbi:MAG TPA: indolepyruvate oxidoreductase subunit beta family protein [Steroidobacteraceae bacterium]|nr:indolepyruvate oxidoreductase subunit beta family protein [Steroidobacteraceae bacterium]